MKNKFLIDMREVKHDNLQVLQYLKKALELSEEIEDANVKKQYTSILEGNIVKL